MNHMNTSNQFVSIADSSMNSKLQPHTFPVPRPPSNMTIEKTTTNSVIVQWTAPVDSLISEYSIRYKTDSDNQWFKLPPVINSTEAEVIDMTPGERYVIQVNSVSYSLESNEPQQLNHTVSKYNVVLKPQGIYIPINF